MLKQLFSWESQEIFASNLIRTMILLGTGSTLSPKSNKQNELCESIGQIVVKNNKNFHQTSLCIHSMQAKTRSHEMDA